MSTHEYWIGKDVNYSSIWNDFETGLGYIDKFQSMEVHLIRLTFEQYPVNLPLFNHEAVFKTLKGYAHDLKLFCFSSYEYERSGPLFFYDVRRESGIWSFLGEKRTLLLLAVTFAEEKILGQKLKNLDAKLQILRENFGDNIYDEDFNRFIKARTSGELNYAVGKLFQQGLKSVEVSMNPFNGNIKQTQASLLDLKLLLNNTDYLTKLRLIFSNRFSLEELRTLCFDLGFDYDDLQGEGKEAKARELVDYYRRRNQIRRLIGIASKLRPDIDWTG